MVWVRRYPVSVAEAPQPTGWGAFSAFTGHSRAGWWVHPEAVFRQPGVMVTSRQCRFVQSPALWASKELSDVKVWQQPPYAPPRQCPPPFPG